MPADWSDLLACLDLTPREPAEPYAAVLEGRNQSLDYPRIFGGQLGTTVMGRFIAEQEKLHSYLVGLHVQPGDWITDHAVPLLSGGLAGRSNGTAGAAGRAVGLVASDVRLQAYSLTFIDAFHLLAWVSVATLILIATIGRFPLGYRDLAAIDTGPPPARTRDQS